MKMLTLFTALFLSLLLTSTSLAAGGEGGAHRDNSALFPQPKADPNKASAPEMTQLLSPAFQAAVSGDSATLKWKEVAEADVYHVQVATDPNFKWLVKEDHQVSGTEFTVTGLEKGKRYYWRVASWKHANMAATNKSAFAASMFETK